MSFFTPLANITESQTIFSEIISQAPSSKSLDAASLSALWTTLSLLSRPPSRAADRLTFLASHLTLLDLTAVHNRSPISSEVQKFLHDLTQSAHETGASLACSSVLAGLSSESDEYGDVSIFLDAFPLGERDREKQIVDMLGLTDWIQEGARIVPFKMGPDGLPSALAQMSETQLSSSRSHIDKLASMLSKLENRFEFRVENRGGSVVYVLLGEFSIEKGYRALVGLVGAGRVSDLE